MKKTILRLVLAVLFLGACGSTPVLADGGSGPVPICYPDPCPK